MRLHVLAGCRELLRPDLLGSSLTASLIGERIRLAPAFWISQRCGLFYHDFLSDVPDNRQVEIFALSLREAFGTRFQPLVVLPELLDAAKTGEAVRSDPEDPRAPMTVLSRLWSSGHFAQLSLHATALPAEVDPSGAWTAESEITAAPVRDRLEGLCTRLVGELRSNAIEPSVIEITPEHPDFARFYGNAVANHAMDRLIPRIRRQGLTTDKEALGRKVVEVFQTWAKRGITPSLPLGSEGIDSIADSLFEQCI